MAGTLSRAALGCDVVLWTFLSWPSIALGRATDDGLSERCQAVAADGAHCLSWTLHSMR